MFKFHIFWRILQPCLSASYRILRQSQSTGSWGFSNCARHLSLKECQRQLNIGKLISQLLVIMTFESRNSFVTPVMAQGYVGWKGISWSMEVLCVSQPQNWILMAANFSEPSRACPFRFFEIYIFFVRWCLFLAYTVFPPAFVLPVYHKLNTAEGYRGVTYVIFNQLRRQ